MIKWFKILLTVLSIVGVTGLLTIAVRDVNLFNQDRTTPMYDFFQTKLKSNESLTILRNQVASTKEKKSKLNALLKYINKLGDYDASIGGDEILETISLCKEFGSKEGLFWGYGWAVMNKAANNNKSESKKYLDSAEVIANQLNDPIAFYYLKYFQQNQYQFENNRKMYFQSLLAQDKLLTENAPWATDLHSITNLQIGRTLLSNGHITFVPRQFVRIAPTTLPQNYLPRYQNFLQDYYVIMKQYDSAYLVLTQDKIIIDTSRFLHRLGRAELFRKNFDQARKHITQSIKSAKSEDSFLNLRYLSMGELYLAEEQLDSALYFTSIAVKLSQKAGDLKAEVESSLLKSELHLKLLDLKQAEIEVNKLLGLIKNKSMFPEKGLDAAKLKWQILLKTKRYNELPQLRQLEEEFNEMIRISGILEIPAEYQNHLFSLQQVSLEKIKSQNRQITLGLYTSFSIGLLFISSLIVVLLVRNKYLKDIKTINSNLEKRVIERTEELVELNAKLETKNKKLLDYAFMNAHKLRAPVARILGLTDLFTKESNKNNQLQYVLLIQKSTNELDDIVKQMQRIVE